MTLMSLKTGSLFGMPRVQNRRDAFLAVLSFLIVSFLILFDDSFYHPAFL